jgi:hypothetical protein
MRYPLSLTLIALLALLGCGGSSSPQGGDSDSAAANAGMSEDDGHSTATGQSMGGGTHQSTGINAEITLDPEIADDWRAIRVRVVDLVSGADSVHDVVIGGESVLGDSGLTLRAVAFIPDFVMGEDGITSRSAEPQNTAARVVIMEDGKGDYEGWLFGAMPEIHAFPHERYGVVLVEGIPAE